MKIDLQSYEIWESLNARMASEIQAPTDVGVRCYGGIAAAVFEMTQGIAQFFSHKRSIALIGGKTPYFYPILPYFYKEGYEVQLAPDNVPLKEWVESLKKDTCFALIAEDHPVTAELYDLSEVDQALNDKKIYSMRISHQNHLYREIPVLPYTARICSYNPQSAIALIGSRLRAPALMAPSMDWDLEGFSQSVQQARKNSFENRAFIQKFENNLPDGFSALLQTSQRCFDRALIYSAEAGGEALQASLARSLGLSLQRPGWETRIETTHMCRWGGTKNYDEWWNPRPAESILRGLLILGTEVLEHPEMRVSLEKALRECQFAELS